MVGRHDADHLGELDAAASIEVAIEQIVADRAAPRTADLGGTASTLDVARAIARQV